MNAVKNLAVVVLLLTTSCGGARTAKSTSSANAAAPASQSDGLSRDRLKKDGDGGGNLSPSDTGAQFALANTTAAQTETAPSARKIIKNAELNLEAAVPEESQQKITAIAESKGGFVIESQQSSSDVKVSTRDVVTMTVRVPAAKFNESLEEIRKTASRVIVETEKGEDVTEEFVDIEARLMAEKALEQQFVEIMKRANSVEDALKVQSQLGAVRTEIERIEGRKRFLENQASLSTIKIRIQTGAALSATSAGFVYRLGESLSTGMDFALNFILGLLTLIIAILPFTVFIVLPLYMIIRYLIRRRGKPETVVSIAKDEIK